MRAHVALLVFIRRIVFTFRLYLGGLLAMLVIVYCRAALLVGVFFGSLAPLENSNLSRRFLNLSVNVVWAYFIPSFSITSDISYSCIQASLPN